MEQKSKSYFLVDILTDYYLISTIITLANSSFLGKVGNNTKVSKKEPLTKKFNGQYILQKKHHIWTKKYPKRIIMELHTLEFRLLSILIICSHHPIFFPFQNQIICKHHFKLKCLPALYLDE